MLQDLRDVADGLEVVHAADQQKAAAQAKRDAKTKRESEKEKKREKNMLKSFDDHWNDPAWKRMLKNYFGDRFDHMVEAKQDEAAGVGSQIDMFADL